MNSQKIDNEKKYLVEEGKKQALMKLLNIMKSLITVSSLKYKSNAILLFKVQKKYKTRKSKFQMLVMVKKCQYQNLQYVAVKN